ncbi:predicted protein [Naegleria gruberi]|uniref:Predicted protein n=1 Tax=Naegleria gruberi TaxID=5762 RepID=D2V861_NAEGR|nr:uncharacterized protein NAEGRDRAFT_65040 [Naegleria gruberi]EFC46990.1 predicted protein [Naegleria gruberi]|eukprot:XP_002679734.1 predicted protein [Naegleria gruberi strain NEG-M]
MKSTLNDDFGSLLPETTPDINSNLAQKKPNNTDSDDSEEDEEDDNGTIGIGKQISLYTKLPPPNVQILPFNFLTKKAEIEGEQNSENLGDELDNLITNIQTREDFENLKSRTNDYLDRLINLVDNLYGQNQNEYVVYHSSRSKKGNKVKKDQAKEQPTTIQFLKALDKANNIMEEVDRSRRETQLKKKIGITHYQKL